MMDTGQRVKLVKSRAWQMRRRQEKHITERLSLVSVALCCCLIYAMGHFPDRSPGAVQGLNGATMLLENAGSYVLVGRYLLYCGGGRYRVLHTIEKEKQ